MKQNIMLRSSLSHRAADLQQQAHQLAVEVYTLTLQFPKYESMVMTPLLRKLSLSVASNTAKGFSARQSNDSIFFMTYANASCHGIKALSQIAKDIGYITEEQNESAKEKCINLSREISMMMDGLEYSEKRRKHR